MKMRKRRRRNKGYKMGIKEEKNCETYKTKNMIHRLYWACSYAKKVWKNLKNLIFRCCYIMNCEKCLLGTDRKLAVKDTQRSESKPKYLDKELHQSLQMSWNGNLEVRAMYAMSKASSK